MLNWLGTQCVGGGGGGRLVSHEVVSARSALSPMRKEIVNSRFLNSCHRHRSSFSSSLLEIIATSFSIIESGDTDNELVGETCAFIKSVLTISIDSVS